MSTTIPRIEAGDVIEVELEGEPTSGIVLLTSDESLILDPCDGRTPVVLRYDELEHPRVFRPELMAA